MQTKQDIPYGQPPEQQMMAVPVGHESGAPWQSGDEIAAASGLTIKQATSECCKFFCCQPNIHFNIHPFKDGNKLDPQENLPTIGFIQEDAGYCGRCWSCSNPGCRQTKYSVHGGASQEDKGKIGQGPVLMTHEKGYTCPVTTVLYVEDNEVRVPCCCCLPYLDTKNKEGQKIGETKYLCDACLLVPKFGVFNASGEQVYYIAPDTCCGGCCVQLKCGKGAKCCHEPYYIRDPKSKDQKLKAHGGDAEITELWDGLKKECCTLKNTFSLDFPNGATPEMKKTLIGSVLLLDMTYFEGGGDGAYSQ